MLLMFMATTLHVFNISPGEGEFGRPVQLSKDVIGGAILYVTPLLEESPSKLTDP